MLPYSNMLLSRRQALQSSACGFGYLALAGLARPIKFPPPLTRWNRGPPIIRPAPAGSSSSSCRAGPSHVDTFDYKPRLASGRWPDADVRRLTHPGPDADQCGFPSHEVPLAASTNTANRAAGSPICFPTWPSTSTIFASCKACTPKASRTARPRCFCTPVRRTWCARPRRLDHVRPGNGE